MKDVVTENQVNHFHEVNFPDSNLDLELVKDVLVISRIYNRNYERLHTALLNGLTIRAEDLRKVEKMLNRANEIMKSLAGIRAKEEK